MNCLLNIIDIKKMRKLSTFHLWEHIQNNDEIIYIDESSLKSESDNIEYGWGEKGKCLNKKD